MCAACSRRSFSAACVVESASPWRSSSITSPLGMLFDTSSRRLSKPVSSSTLPTRPSIPACAVSASSATASSLALSSPTPASSSSRVESAAISATRCGISPAGCGRLSRRSSSARRPAISSVAAGRDFSSSSSRRSASSSVGSGAFSRASTLAPTASSALARSAPAWPAMTTSSLSSTALIAARTSQATRRRSSCHGVPPVVRSTARSRSSRPATTARSSTDHA